eukprot:CAMPEP_0176134276 /NCGR_PEP_ID=MMETSP0120_2-20121206/68094_1 /TAXON_ID=160619 /ORGANISM="Kryptoperidinium foliaceum, Strain CCMP 1326" /LENGTH=46 /DNA_ID= /DNA_START= /DNA_END= /DNA_ORIENTATION=
METGEQLECVGSSLYMRNLLRYKTTEAQFAAWSATAAGERVVAGTR